MSRKSVFGFVFLPTCAFGSYFACLKYFPVFTKRYLHTEHGAIEWGTAIVFLIAALLGGHLAWRTRTRVPTWCTVLYSLFALAGLFVTLEEVSYGQKFFNWDTPKWFTEHNSKSETNLHNMFDNKPSNLLRSIATIGCPVCCIVLPLWRRIQQFRRQPVAWTEYCVPGPELITLAFLTIALTVLNKIPSVKGMATWSGHLGELKELYWGVTAACYAAIILRRLSHSKSLGAVPLNATSANSDGERRAA